jgi:hypothetical protein
VTAPCAAPVQVTAVSPVGASVLCADATVHQTGDAGTTWVSSQPISGVSTIAAREDTVLAVIERQGECAGLQVVALDAAAGLSVGAPGACITTEPTDGHTALTVSNDGAMVWLWSNGVVARSVDGGVSW